MLPFHYSCACILLLLCIHFFAYLSLICIRLGRGKWMLPSYKYCPIREAGHWNWNFRFVRLSHFFFFFPFQRSNLSIARGNQSKVCWHLPSDEVTITFGLFFSFHVLSRCCCFSHWKLWMLNTCERKSLYKLNRLGLIIPLTKLKNQHMLWKAGN